jgi:hypothetical protein
MQNALLQSSSHTLLLPYQMWRFEQSGSGQYSILLAIQGSEQPPLHHLPDIQPQHIYPQNDLLFNTGDFVGKGSCSSTPANALRYAFVLPNGCEISGWAFPLRQGSHLLAAIGLTEVTSQMRPISVLFDLPEAMLQDVISQHLTLGNCDLLCSPPNNGRSWLLVRKPELYIMLKWKAEPQIKLYQSLEPQANLMTPWAYSCPLAARLQMPSNHSILLLDSEGGSTWLDPSSWWMSSEMISLPNFTAQNFTPEQNPPKIELKIRFNLKYDERDIPSLWLLRGNYALNQLESLFWELSPDVRDQLQIFVGNIYRPDANHLSNAQYQATPLTDSVYIVRDQREPLEAPLFVRTPAVGFVPMIPDIRLFLQHDYAIQPVIPAEIWQRELDIKLDQYALLIPPSNPDNEPEIMRFSAAAFAPLESLVEYKLGTVTQELKPLNRATILDILFAVKQVDVQLAENTNNIKQRPSFPDIPTLPEQSLSKFAPMLGNSDTALDSPICVHEQREVSDPRLKQIEITIRNKNQKNIPIIHSEWITLADLYRQEYAVNCDIHWLNEAILCLDQVLCLDRQAEKAVEIERKILEDILSLSVSDFNTQMQQLDAHIIGHSVIFARFAFRYRTRILIEQRHPPNQAIALRQNFYRELALLEDKLLIREHFIYVSSVAQIFEDRELNEAARTRYRQQLDDPYKLISELPTFLR